MDPFNDDTETSGDNGVNGGNQNDYNNDYGSQQGSAAFPDYGNDYTGGNSQPSASRNTNNNNDYGNQIQSDYPDYQGTGTSLVPPPNDHSNDYGSQPGRITADYPDYGDYQQTAHSQQGFSNGPNNQVNLIWQIIYNTSKAIIIYALNE